MRSRLALVALLALAGCGGGGAPQPEPDQPPTPAQAQARAQCEVRAYDDPAVKDLIIRRNSGNDSKSVELLPDQRDAVKDATQRCLAQKGLAPRGGVERVKR
jgi:predicted small lipoprotein YifL